MRGYESNNCRLCAKTFCCENCRVKHEINTHKIFPNCDICVYGQFTFGNIEDYILKHLEDCHLPLHCVYCKRIFKSIKDILQHRKCPILQNKEEYPETPFKDTPPIIISNEDNQSPILLGQEHLKHIFNLATSTPMQKGTEVNIFEKSREPLTPVDKGSLVNSKSIIKKVDSLRSENSSNRRVTFGNTPSRNNDQKKCVTVTDKVKEAAFENEKIKENIITVSELKNNTNEQNKDPNDKNLDNLEQPSRYQSNSTPNVGISNDQFYSAKSECDNRNHTNSGTKEFRQNIKIEEGFTPVSAPNTNKSKVPVFNKDFNEQQSPDIKAVLTTIKTEDNLNEMSMNLCTPEPPKIISRTEENIVNEMSAIKESTKEINDTSSDDTHHESKLQANQNTMWLSAVNSEEENSVTEINNKEPALEKSQVDDDTKQTSPPKTNRKVSIYVASPLIQRTDVQMKFQFPAHLSSTPIMSHNTLKIKRTKIVEEISTKLVACQTPFKTPQGKLFKIVQRKLNGQNPNVQRNFISSTLNEQTTIKNTDEKRNYLNNGGDEDPFEKENIPSVFKSPNLESQISVSSMTESSLWTSMTKIAKNVLGRFTHTSNPEISYNNHSDSSSSFKRHHSESDDIINLPRSKRFKFCDIKCRRPIRPSNELVPISKLPSSNNALARLEIVKSVTTLYGNEKIRIQSHKSTQTDDYLMYGWYPKI